MGRAGGALVAAVPHLERTPHLEHPTPLPVASAAPTLIQPALAGLEAGPDAAPRSGAAGARRARQAAPRVKGRRRYWSIRDLSRRLWFGRGYEVLRQLIRAGILPAARSARSWWVEDADVLGLLEAFDAPAGKVRAFRGLDGWLRERCWVTPATAEAETLLPALRAGFIWRGNAYLPKSAWQVERAAGGQVTYRHHSGAALPTGDLLAA